MFAARLTVDPRLEVGPINRRLFGSFVEHLGRGIYQGIYEPGHPTADKNGMRGDVAQLVRDLDIPMVRYPGGNFVSAYNWEDGIGPRDKRPTRLDLAWHTSDSNAVGVHEFIDWCDTVNTKPMLAINLGSRGLDQARNFVEYINGPTGSYWGDLRKSNGRKDPWDVKLWCLGNEMDGPWQVGHKTADEYGRLANETAKALRAFDSSLELIVCGSSHSYMPTYPDWERTVLEHTYDAVDHISLHMYFNNRAQNTANYLAMNARLEEYIGTVASTIEFVRARKRSKKRVYISFDEWNVWYHSNEQDRKILDGAEGWPHAPRLLEDIYNFEDVLQVGCIINTFIRRSDIVRIACIAQLVNVIAPIMTDPGGSAWRQTIYWPFMLASRYGRGTALQLAVEVPTYDAAVADKVPWLDIAGVHNSNAGTLTFFAINRHGSETIEAEIALERFAAKSIEHTIIRHDDLEACNTKDAPDNVAPVKGNGATLNSKGMTLNLPPHSYSMVRVTL